MTSEIVATAKPGLEGKPDASDKARLRAAALARRDALEPSARHHHSAALAQNAASLDWPRGPVSGFWPMRSEVDPRPLMRLLAGRGMPLALPRVERHGLSFRSFTFEDTLMRAGFGLSEPLPHAPEVRPAAMIVPLAAFDRRGHRIGYGAGHYDRAIARLHGEGRRPRLIGIAFDCQEVELVPDEPHDVVIPEILTESGLRRFGAPL